MAGRGDNEYVLAMHDFVPANGNSTCLSFRAGQVIHVLNKDETGWWDGELEGRRGWFPSNYVKAGKKLRVSGTPGDERRLTPTQRKGSPSSESGSDAESCPRVMVSLYHALLVLNTSVHAARVSHYQPSTACVISSVRTVLTATDCLHKTAPALARYPHLARARSDVLQELGRLVSISKKASAVDVPDDERAWLAENMLRYGDAVFASCKRYVEVAVSCGIQVAERRPLPQLSMTTSMATTTSTTNSMVAARLSSASASSLSSVSSSTSPPSPAPQFPSGAVPASQLLSALRTTHDHLLSIIAAFIGHVHSHSRASHASSKGHLIEMTRETVDKVRQVLTIVGAVCDHPAVVGPEKLALGAAKDALYGATSVLVEAVKRMLAPAGTLGSPVGREEEEKAVAVQAATGTLRAGGDCVTAVRSCLTRYAGIGYGSLADTMPPLVFEVPAAPPSVSDARSVSGASASGSEASAPAYVNGNIKLRTRWARRPSLASEGRSSEDEPRRTSIEEARTPSSEPDQPRYEAKDEQPSYWPRPATHDQSQFDDSRPEVDEPRLEPDSLGPDSPIPDQLTPQPTQIRPSYIEAEAEDTSLGANLGARERDSSATEVPIVIDQPEPEEERAPSDSESSVEPEPEVPLEDEPEAGPEVPLKDKPDEAPELEPEIQPEPDSPEQEQPEHVQEEADQASLMPVVISSASSIATTSRGASFDAPSTFTRDQVRLSFETGLTSIDESVNQAVTPVGEREEDEYDPEEGESLMVEPPTMLIEGDGSGEEDGIVLVDPHRTPIPSQSIHLSDSAVGLQDDTPSITEKSLPAVPEPIPISPGVDWLAAQTIDPRDVAYNNDGNLIGATLDVLVEKMTPPDHSPEPKLSATFYLTFRMFTTPLELVQVLQRRWDLQPPLGSSFTPEEHRTWSLRKLEPVRLRVYNFIKTWLDSHWQSGTDSVALGPLKEFVSMTATAMPPAAVQRVVDLLTQREPSSDVEQSTVSLVPRPALADRARSDTRSRSKPNAPPTPIMSKSLFALLKAASYSAVSVVDFDALELARQFTIMESRLFCKILPEEILEVGLPSNAGERGNSIRAMSTLSTAITGWVTEMILDEQDIKKRTGLLKFFIKIADQCHELNNFSTLRSILAALDSSTISRLSKTWMGLSAKNKARLENLRKLTDHTRNHHEYRSRLRGVHGHAVPFLGLYLTDVTFCREGNPDKRVAPYDNSRTLLNFDKYRRLAGIADDVKRFQAPYNLIEIPEVQKYLQFAFEKAKKNGNDLQDLYRRSLLVEPRQPADNIESKTGTMKSSELFGWASRDKS
ncbi:Ras guanine nucleotide exchange-like protein [Ceratobasidium sp. AG-Ba]|nr:Ras guanine nucleotide exchange-like protein [Ceratobasidium sp. AG-Ba]